MTQRTVGSWLQQWTCVGGTCAPAPAAPKSSWERAMDTYTGLAAPVLRGCYAIPVAIAVFLISRGIGGGGLYLSGLYFIAYSAYCLANLPGAGKLTASSPALAGASWAPSPLSPR